MIGTTQIKQWASASLPTSLVVTARYPRESLFVRGWTNADTASPSVLFFTTQKCASTLMRRMLATLNKRALHLTHLNLAAYLWNATGDEPAQERLSRHAKHYFQDHGILYAPLRDYIDISHLRDARPLVMLRDPRDILVSAFYSTAYIHRPPSHPGRRKAWLANRNHVRSIGLEGHVRERAPILAARFERYRRNFPRHQIVTYEQMWWDFRGFIQQLADILNITLDEALIQELESLADVGGNLSERQNTIRRKGTPGDHRDKLSPAMIDELNDTFAESLDWLYPASQKPDTPHNDVSEESTA